MQINVEKDPVFRELVNIHNVRYIVVVPDEDDMFSEFEINDTFIAYGWFDHISEQRTEANWNMFVLDTVNKYVDWFDVVHAKSKMTITYSEFEELQLDQYTYQEYSFYD